VVDRAGSVCGEQHAHDEETNGPTVTKEVLCLFIGMWKVIPGIISPCST